MKIVFFITTNTNYNTFHTKKITKSWNAIYLLNRDLISHTYIQVNMYLKSIWCIAQFLSTFKNIYF